VTGPCLTRPQQALLDRLRRDGPQVFNGRARRTIARLEDLGLVTAKWDSVPHAKGCGMYLTERITVTAVPADRAGRCVIDGTPIDGEGLCSRSCQPADRAQWIRDGNPLSPLSTNHGDDASR
jgi:hypothetical protein